MTIDSMLLVAIGVILGALVGKRATWMARRRKLDGPVSRQWLLDQRVREE
jgi:hypothetical protein